MAKHPSDLDLISKRRELLDRERKELAARMDDMKRKETLLEQEAHELLVTERTLARLHNIELPDAPAEPEPPSGGGKPFGTPTVLDMAYAVIATDAEPQGQLFMEAQDIVAAIRRRWWPTVKSNDIAPTLWRAAKEGRIFKTGTRYARVKPDEKRSAAEIAKINDKVNG